jgi:hypothetical protein
MASSALTSTPGGAKRSSTTRSASPSAKAESEMRGARGGGGTEGTMAAPLRSDSPTPPRARGLAVSATPSWFPFPLFPACPLPLSARAGVAAFE